jgi:hypothetical protein
MREYLKLHHRLSAKFSLIHHLLLRLHKHYQMLFKNSWLSIPLGPLNNSLQQVFILEIYQTEEISKQINQYGPSLTTSTLILLNLPPLTSTSRNLLLVNSNQKKRQMPSPTIQLSRKQIIIITCLIVHFTQKIIKGLSVQAFLNWARKNSRW